MFLLIIKSARDDHVKYINSNSYDSILQLIYSYEDIKMIDDFHYKNKELSFVIKLSEVI